MSMHDHELPQEASNERPSPEELAALAEAREDGRIDNSGGHIHMDDDIPAPPVNETPQATDPQRRPRRLAGLVIASRPFVPELYREPTDEEKAASRAIIEDIRARRGHRAARRPSSAHATPDVVEVHDSEVIASGEVEYDDAIALEQARSEARRLSALEGTTYTIKRDSLGRPYACPIF